MRFRAAALLISILFGPLSLAKAGGEAEALTGVWGTVTPTLDCNTGRPCDIRIRAIVDGQRLLSPPLPFVVSVDDPTSFNEDGVWVFGSFHDEVQLTIETLDTGVGDAILLRQWAGFDHVKRAYTILVPTSAGLRTVESWTEHIGPDALELAPLHDGVRLSRSFNDGPVETKVYRWTDDGTDLVKVK